jgi:hypothetical protein
MAGPTEGRDPVDEVDVGIDVVSLVVGSAVVPNPSRVAFAQLANATEVDRALDDVVSLERI